MYQFITTYNMFFFKILSTDRGSSFYKSLIEDLCEILPLFVAIKNAITRIIQGYMMF